MKQKYFKPLSLTWWASFMPLAMGLIVATLPLHGWAAGAETINLMSNNTPSGILINAGLAGIGLRGALS
tara:strand:- start:1063 stop:1269 length:207 start_codon:yes stop_codon:yes gene_type:complete